MKRKKRVVRVGLIKFMPKKWNLKYNWGQFEKLAVRTAEEGVQLICTSECMLDGYVPTLKKSWSKKRFREISQSLTGDNYLRRAKELARECKVHIIFGFTELGKGGSYNSAALIDDKGKLSGCYHKTHLPAQDVKFLPGKGLPVFDTSLGKIGILICADRWWPEAARTLLIKGAELIMIPMYGSWDINNEWAMRTRSTENECFLCVIDPNVAFICDPAGNLLAKLQSNVPDVLVHDIDMSVIPKFRMGLRRPDIYKIK